MKISLLIILISLYSSLRAQEVIIPQHYSIRDSAVGDLDKDGTPELVIAYNTREEVRDSSQFVIEGAPRELWIYKKTAGKWMVWKKSAQALLGSQDGGMMGDPFEDLFIEKGILLVSHSGGSSWKWGYTDKYRYQNGEFYLIGYNNTAGKPCEYWESVDFNLQTGKLIVTKEYEKCDEEHDQLVYKRENETLYNKQIEITLQKRNDKEILIVTPKYKHEIYLAWKQDEK